MLYQPNNIPCEWNGRNSYNQTIANVTGVVGSRASSRKTSQLFTWVPKRCPRTRVPARCPHARCLAFCTYQTIALYEWSGLNSYKQTLANVNGVVRLYGHLDRHRDCLRGYPCGVRARGYPRGARILVGFFYQPNNCPYEWSRQNSYNQTIEWILNIRMVF